MSKTIDNQLVMTFHGRKEFLNFVSLFNEKGLAMKSLFLLGSITWMDKWSIYIFVKVGIVLCLYLFFKRNRPKA